jgi:hypothetical protein
VNETRVNWTDYLHYRARLRGFDLAEIERILRYSNERYVDAATGSLVAVGRHGGQLIMVPYQREGGILTALTVHTTTRRQINFRVRSGRLRHE